LQKLLFSMIAALTSVPAVAAGAEPERTATGVEIAGPVLMVTDLERSLRFYINGLGLQSSTRLTGNPGPGAIIVASGQAATPFLLIRQTAASPKRSPQVVHGNGLSRVMLVVPDSAAAAARLTSAGFAHEPVSARGIFFVEDPDGYRYEVMQRQSKN